VSFNQCSLLGHLPQTPVCLHYLQTLATVISHQCLTQTQFGPKLCIKSIHVCHAVHCSQSTQALWKIKTLPLLILRYHFCFLADLLLSSLDWVTRGSKPFGKRDCSVCLQAAYCICHESNSIKALN